VSVEILGLHLRTPTPFIVDGEINIEKLPTGAVWMMVMQCHE
jgi:hypothetical protein